MNLSKDEAIRFMAEVLGIVDLKNLKEDRLSFLNELIRAIHRLVPFQNVTLLRQTEEKRHRPTVDEIKSAMMSGFGGLCYTVGVFTTYLLRALGYETDLVTASIHKHPDNHVIAIVHNLTGSGSKHLVDAWSGWPTFEAIPLNFVDESPIYQHSFLEIKFVNKGDTILRYHRKGDKYDKRELNALEEWSMVEEVDLTPRELSYFDHSMSELFTKPGLRSPFLVSFRVVEYQGKDMKLVAVKNLDLFLENDSHEVEVRRLQSRDEMISVMKRYFSQFTVEDVTRAMDTLHYWDNI